MEKPIVFMYSGQGAQYYRMGEDLFNHHPVFKKYMLSLDEIALECLGVSIVDLLYHGPDKKNEDFTHTVYSSMAILMVECALTQVLLKYGIKPNMVLGASLGEYAAMVTAGTREIEELMPILARQLALYETYCEKGKMIGVLRSRDFYDNTPGLNEYSELCGVNFDSHFVVSCAEKNVNRVEDCLKKEAVAFQTLPVSFAFHSSFLDPAEKRHKALEKNVSYRTPKIPFISCMHAGEMTAFDANYSWDVFRKPILFQETIQGLEKQRRHTYIDLGTAGTLANFVKYNLGADSRSEAFSIMVPFGRDRKHLKAVKDHLRPAITKDKTMKTFMFPGKGEMTYEEIGHGRVLTNMVAGIQKETSSPVQSAKAPAPIDPAPVPITAVSLGCMEFKKDYNLKYNYVSGGMYRAIASKELVARMAKAGLLAYFGAGGIPLGELEKTIRYLKDELNEGQSFGINLVYNNNTRYEKEIVDLFLKLDVRNVEAASYMSITPGLVTYRLKGACRSLDGTILPKNRIMAKVSRPEVAQIFLQPAPAATVEQLKHERIITPEEAELAKHIPMADDLCVEADSGGHTDMGVSFTLMPVMLKMRDEMMTAHGYSKKIRVGAAGGIGTPEAAAAAFILGADFILTGSINQCTVEAGVSNLVKDMLQDINVQDTAHAPAGDMFEMGTKVQVLKKGVFFPARANKLYDLYRHYNSIDEIDEKTRKQLQEKIFKRSFDEIYEDVKRFYPQEEIERAEKNPKQKMAFIFRWYLGRTTWFALNGDKEHKVNFQIHCGPALGAFNQWVKGTELEKWENRNVDEIGKKIMTDTAKLLNLRFQSFQRNASQFCRACQ